jgi:hypothetical protein
MSNIVSTKDALYTLDIGCPHQTSGSVCPTCAKDIRAIVAQYAYYTGVMNKKDDVKYERPSSL